MLISMAHAQEVTADIMETADAPSAANAFAWNMGMILILVVMFYVLLIRPQQKRLQEHKLLMDGLKKGDKVSTAGGLIGKIDKIIDEKEVMLDLGNGVKVTALRHTLGDILDAKDDKKEAKAKDQSKKEAKKK